MPKILAITGGVGGAKLPEEFFELVAAERRVVGARVAKPCSICSYRGCCAALCGRR